MKLICLNELLLLFDGHLGALSWVSRKKKKKKKFLDLISFSVRAQPPLTLFLVSHYPETGHSSPLYIYGLSKYAFDVEAGVEASITKDGGLPSDRVQVGTIDRDLFSFGCYLRVDELNRFRGLRYGQYTGTITVGGNVVYSGYTFVKPKTGQFNVFYRVFRH